MNVVISLVYVHFFTGSKSLSLHPSCVNNGQWMYLKCCLGTRLQPASWTTNITGRPKTAALADSGLKNVTFLRRANSCEKYGFIATPAVNGSWIYCSNGNSNSSDVTIRTNKGCESATYVCVYYDEIHIWWSSNFVACRISTYCCGTAL